MDFSKIIGQKHLKSHLLKTAIKGRIPHAQLFVGVNGSGLLPMALAYAKELLCKTFEKHSPEYEACSNRIDKLVHPDLHFIYPVNTNDRIKKNPVSSHFIDDWRSFVLKTPYGSLFDWFQELGIENKQGNISVNDAEEIGKKLALKSYEGGYKVMIIWMAEKMNISCANKILKLLEEPSDKTVLLLLSENEQQIIPTIRSRCQKLQFPLLSHDDITTALISNYQTSENLAKKTAHLANGDYNRALHILKNDNNDVIFEEWFVNWVRTAFKAKGNKKAILELLNWSELMAGQGRETMKKFLSYCLELFRQAMLKNYTADSLLFLEFKDPKFSLEKFAPFVHQNNIFEITSAIEKASYHIERNGNAKLIFSDLSIQLTRLIHKSESA